MSVKMEKNPVDAITNAVMIHGRFQPFTLGHMQLVKKAIKLTTSGTKILIGITKPDLETDNHISKGDNHRDNIASNPYTYMLRKEMIVCSLLLDEDSRDRIEDFVIFPFPLSRDGKNEAMDAIMSVANKENIDGKITQLVNTIEGDGWEEEKAKLFQEMGFEIKNISENGERIKTDDGVEISASRYRKTKDSSLLTKGTNKVRKIINDSKRFWIHTDSNEEPIDWFDTISYDMQNKILIALRQELLNDEEIREAICRLNNIKDRKKNLGR